jgi:type IV secretion system protein VirB9
MKSGSRIFITAVALAVVGWDAHAAEPVDPRVRDLLYDGHSIITVNVRQGVVTEIDLDPNDLITFAATGYGSDCEGKDEQASWCIAALPGQHVVFVKPRSIAAGENNLQVVTKAGHSYSFVFALLGKTDKRDPVHRLLVRLPAPPPPPAPARAMSFAPLMAPPDPEKVVAERLAHAEPKVVNTSYSLAVGKDSDDIVPTLVFDDGRMTYFRFPGNREVPAVFQRDQAGAESMVNSEMDGDLLRVDRVGREFYLRSGNRAVRVWNDAFDINGRPSEGGTTVAGVERVLKTDAEKRLVGTNHDSND